MLDYQLAFGRYLLDSATALQAISISEVARETICRLLADTWTRSKRRYDTETRHDAEVTRALGFEFERDCDFPNLHDDVCTEIRSAMRGWGSVDPWRNTSGALAFAAIDHDGARYVIRTRIDTHGETWISGKGATIADAYADLISVASEVADNLRNAEESAQVPARRGR